MGFPLLVIVFYLAAGWFTLRLVRCIGKKL
jgi:hypothetical protein